jgi:hypothetical protein
VQIAPIMLEMVEKCGRYSLIITKQKLIRLAKKMNCRLEFEPAWDFTSPPNTRFIATESHYIVFDRNGGLYTLEDCYLDALSRLETGLQECQCGDCDPHISRGLTE